MYITLMIMDETKNVPIDYLMLCFYQSFYVHMKSLFWVGT